MNAQQVIEGEIERTEDDVYSVDLNTFLQRVSIGIRNNLKITPRQRRFILSQISFYSMVSEPRVENIGIGVQGEMATKEAHQRWLCCPNTVNSFVTAINSLGAK